MATLIVYCEIATGHDKEGPVLEELGFEVEYDAFHDTPDPSVGWRGGWDITFDERSFQLNGRKFSRDEMRVLLALGGEDLDDVLKKYEEEAVEQEEENKPEPDYDDYDDYGCGYGY